MIEEVRATEDFAFEEVDIDGDDVLVRDYGVRIPVVELDGVELFEISVDPTALRAAVRGHRDPGRPG